MPSLFDGQDALPTFFATQRLDCKFVPRVVSAQKDLVAFRQASALWHAHELSLAGWVANRTSEPLSDEAMGEPQVLLQSYRAAFGRNQVFIAALLGQAAPALNYPLKQGRDFGVQVQAFGKKVKAKGGSRLCGNFRSRLKPTLYVIRETSR